MSTDTTQNAAKVRYQALGPLMAGEGSRAFLGLRILDDREARPCALIWVPEAASTDNAAVAALKKETDRAASLEHPNVVRVFGLVALEEGLARVVEFLDGESLRKVLESKRPLPVALSALIAADAAMGLHFAHLAGNDDGSPLLHGDVRPETLMVTFSGFCKVSGYGALTLAPREVGGKRVLGRRLYCAPEQVLGGRDSVNRQTDVFLLGLVLYECLTGKRPWEGAASLEEAVVGEPLPLLSSGQLPAPLIEVIQRATAKRASDRYPSALDFKEAVEKAAGSLAPRADLASLLAEVFPENEAARAARRREIDSGIAEFAKRHGLPVPPPSLPPPAAFAPPTPSLTNGAKNGASGGKNGALAAAAPAPRSRPAAAPSPAPSLAPEPTSTSTPAPARPARPSFSALAEEVSDWAARPLRRKKWLLPAVVGVTVSIVLVMLMTRETRRPTDIIGENDRAQSAAADEASAPAPTSAPAPAPAPKAEPAASPEPAKAAAPAPVPAAEPPPKPAKVPPAPVPASLAMKVDPPVEVSIDGKSYGTAPIDVPMKPGKYVVKLVDAKQGVNTSRTVTVAGQGKTQMSVKLGKGTVALSAPEGAVVTLDGKVVGKAPLGELSVYEGQHHLVVRVGKAKWQQKFAVRATERMYFTVETTYE